MVVELERGPGRRPHPTPNRSAQAMLSSGAAAAELGVGPTGEAEAGSRSSPSSASPPIAFPPLLSASAAATRSPGDRLHSAVAQLLVRREPAPPPRAPRARALERATAAAACRVSHPHVLLRHGLRACRRGSHPHELPSTSTVDSSGRGEIPWRASPSLADERTPSGRTPIASPPSQTRPWRRWASASRREPPGAATLCPQLPRIEECWGCVVWVWSPRMDKAVWSFRSVAARSSLNVCKR